MNFRTPDAAEGSRSLSTFERGPLAQQGATPPETVGELVSRLSSMFPPANAEPWDKTGLLVGDASWKVEGVATALDPTLDAVAQTEALGANVLLTHHPVFLDPPALLAPLASGGSVSAAVAFEAIRRGIALVNYHTALDVSAQAQRMLPGLLRLRRIGVLSPLPHDESLGYGQICRTLEDEEPLTVESLALRCTSVFGRAPRVWGDPTAQVGTAVTWTGSTGDACERCIARGIDVLVCGEVKYHTALDAAQAGLSIIELGHDVSELPFTAVLAEAAAQAGVPRAAIAPLSQNSNWTHPESRRV